MVLELANCCFECIADRYVNIRMRLVEGGLSRRDNLTTRNGDVDFDMVGAPFVVMTMGRFHHDSAARNPAIELLEPLCVLPYSLLDARRRRHVSERDLKRDLH
jgi:hypothetical protein